MHIVMLKQQLFANTLINNRKFSTHLALFSKIETPILTGIGWRVIYSFICIFSAEEVDWYDMPNFLLSLSCIIRFQRWH